MEKIAIISDIHANKTALEAVLEDIKKRNIKRIFCLGDLVFKGANPDIVIDLVRKNCEVVLKGNCDDTATWDKSLIRKYWTRMKIGEERALYLKKLPIMHEFYISGHLVRVFHSSPFALDNIYNPVYSNVYNNYANSEIKDPLEMFKNTSFIGKTNKDAIPYIIGYGHIHTPNLFRCQNKLIFNTGSVGAPNEMRNLGDENDITNKLSTVASYTIIEDEYGSKKLASISISNVRVPYDIAKEIEYLKNSDLPGKENIIFTLQTASAKI